MQLQRWRNGSVISTSFQIWIGPAGIHGQERMNKKKDTHVDKNDPYILNILWCWFISTWFKVVYSGFQISECADKLALNSLRPGRDWTEISAWLRRSKRRVISRPRPVHCPGHYNSSRGMSFRVGRDEKHSIRKELSDAARSFFSNCCLFVVIFDNPSIKIIYCSTLNNFFLFQIKVLSSMKREITSQLKRSRFFWHYVCLVCIFNYCGFYQFKSGLSRLAGTCGFFRQFPVSDYGN